MLALLTITLAHLYSDPADWKRLIIAAGLDFSRLNSQASALNFWHTAVYEAHHQDAVLTLVEVAYSEYPHDQNLNNLLAYYQESGIRGPEGAPALAPPDP